jgi:uncharacterized cupredoxin-like copper-binding protein
MVDIAFEPSEFSIAADTPTVVELPNEGAALHSFVIDELGVNVEVEAAGSGQAEMTAPAGGYTFYCDVPGHRAAGMEGTMTVA